MNTLPRLAKVAIEDLRHCKEPPYNVWNDITVRWLVAEIAQNGVCIPLIVRACEAGGYEVVEGQKRLYAAKLAGVKVVPVMICELEEVGGQNHGI